MVTALTLNANQDVSSSLITADQLVTTQTGTTSSGIQTKIGLLTGWGQLYAKGNTGAWPALGAIGAPDGNGWLLDNTSLEGQTILAGNWQWIGKSRITAGTATADMVVRYYKYNAGVYTLIVSMTLSAQSLTSTTTTYTSAAIAASAVSFGTGDKLYKDVWYNVTANSGAGSGTLFAIQTCNNAGLGLTGAAQTTTPGYSPTTSGFNAYLSNAVSATQANADQLYTVAGTPTTTPRDIVVGKSLKFGEITSQGNTISKVDSPYGAVYYFGGHPGGTVNLLSAKFIDLLVGGNRSGLGAEVGWIPGGPIWARPQIRWELIEYPTAGTYDWSVVDDMVSRLNAANILINFNIMIPPSFRLDTDVNGNAVTAGSSTAVFASGAATTNFAKELAARYNGTTTNAIHGNAQTALTINAFQWNEDYDAAGTNAQRTNGSKWFVENWQIVGPFFRQYAPSAILVGPASRSTTDGFIHRTTWTDNIFTYQPAGRSWAGAIVDSLGNRILDALDFHYYRNGATDLNGTIDPDPNNTTYLKNGQIDVATPAQIITAFKQVAANHGYTNFDVWCTETGWNVWNDNAKPNPYVTEAQQSQYLQETLDQHRLNGGSHVQIWVVNPTAIADFTVSPTTSLEPKSICFNEKKNSGTTFRTYAAYNDIRDTYIPAYPNWGGASGSTWAGSTTLPAQTGNGWLLDLPILDGQQFAAGATWSATVTFSATVSGGASGTIVADLHVRASRYRPSDGSYLTIANTVLAAQTINTAITAFTTTATGSLAKFQAGDKLYLDVWPNITTNANNNVLQAIRIHKISTDTTGLTGDPGALLAAPAYTPTVGPPALSIASSSLSFAALVGGANPASQNDNLSNTGGTATAWTSTIVYGSGSGWLSLSPANSTSNLAANGSLPIAFTCAPGLMAAGTYTATVTFTATTGGTTAVVNVTFTISPVATPVLSASPTSLLFTDIAGGAGPALQNTTLAETAGVATAWTSSIAYSSNGSGWLALTPSSDSLLAFGNEDVGFTCTTGARAADNYSAVVTFTATTGGAITTVTVNFVVTATQGLTVAVSSNPVMIYTDSYDLDDSIGQASTIMFKIRDDSGANHYTKGQPIKVVDSVLGKQYTGFISAAIEDRESPNPLMKTDTGGRDNHYLLEKRTYDGPEFTNTPAGAILCQILNIAAQEGITAQYATDRDTTAIDFNTGALTSVIGASNVDDGDLELAPAGTAVTISEATTATFATGTLTGVVAANNTLKPTATNAIKLVATCSQPGSNNAYTYMKIWAGSHLVAASESFSYDIFVLPSSPSGQMGIDVLFTDGTNWRDTALVTDTQFVMPHPKNDVGPMGVGQWYHRSFSWGQYSGKTIQSVQVVSEGDAVGVYTGYFRNIQLNASPFTFSLNTTQQISNNGYSSSVVSVVPTYDLISALIGGTTEMRQTIAYSIDAAKILQSSNVTWTAVEPPGTKFILKYSIDGGTVFHQCTKNAPLPNLPAGSNIAGKSLIFLEQFWYDLSVAGTSRPGPEDTPVLSALQVTIQPSYTDVKTDILYEVAGNAAWTAGTFTNTLNTGGGRQLYLLQSTRQWDDGDSSSQTLFSASAATSPDRQAFHISVPAASGGVSAEARSRMDFAGTIADGTMEVDILVNDASAILSAVYRTTHWENHDLSWAYAVEVTQTTIKLFKGPNSSTYGFTQIGTTATLNVSSGNWHRLKVVFVGSSHKVYLDDVLYINQTDATYTAAGNVALRVSNPNTGASYLGFFDNFGVISAGAALTGQWVSPAQSLASAGTYGTSVVSWRDMSSDPGNSDTLLVETQVDASTWQTCTNGQPIPNLPVGQSLSGISVKVRITLTTTTASTYPGIDNVVVRVSSQLTATGRRLSPALPLTTVGTLGGSVIAWNNVALPSGCTLGVDVRIDAGAWTDITANNGGAIPGFTAQAPPWVDLFTVDSSANYTSTHNDGNSNTVWTWDIANKRVTTNGSGYDGCLVYNGLTFVDGYVEADMDQVDNGGLACRRVDGNNMYLVYFADASASDFWGGTNTFWLYKLVAGAYIVLVSAPISFVRGTYHRFRLSTIGTTISLLMDGVQLASVTDSSISTAGKAGLIGNSGSSGSHFYSMRVQPTGQDVTSHSIQLRQRLASTNPLASPQITDIIVAVFGPTIQAGATIPQTSMFHKYLSDCITDIANTSNYWWNIDKNLTPYFLSPNALPAPWVASDGGSVPTSGDFLDANITVEDASDSYFNREIVDNVLAPVTINETRLGDGISTSWVFGDEWAGAPVVTITNTITGVVSVATVGIKNVDTGRQFYYAVGDNTITEDSSGPLYDFTFSLNFTGPGQYLTYSQYDNVTAQAERAAKEQIGTGIVTRTVDGTGLTKAQGDALAQADVTKNSVLGRLIKATTRRNGLAVGQALTVFLPAHNTWNDLFLIRSIKTTLTTEFPNGTAGGGIQQGWHAIEAISGPDLGDWTRLYKRPKTKPPL